MSWPLVQIDKYVEKVRTWNPAAGAECVFQYVDLSSVDKSRKIIDPDNVAEISSAEAPSRARQLVVAGDVLVATVRPNLNGVAVVPAELNGATASTGYCVLRADEKNLHGRYLFHWVQTGSFVGEMMSKATGANYPAVSDKIVKESKIPLPPLPEQKRIAAILDKADAIRRKRQQAIQLADDFLRAVFLDMFGDPVTNPKGWQTFTLAEVVRKDSIITYGIVQAGEHVDGGVPYIRTGDFKGGKLVRSGYACTSSEIASKFKRSEVSPGDIVYCIRASVGSADVVPDFLAGANLTQGTAKISPASDMKSEFLVELLRSAGFRSWIDKNSKGATFKEITLGRLREAPVFKPPLVEQEAFVRIKKIVMDRLAGKFRETDVPLFESLSQKAFCGEL